MLVVFDQMRGDYLEKWQPLFGEGGFRRLQTDGAWFADCHYPYAHHHHRPGPRLGAHRLLRRTGTASSTTTGTTGPAAKTVYCAASDRYEFVPPAVEAAAAGRGQARRKRPKQPKRPATPTGFSSRPSPTSFKEATGGAGKVFGLSLKDRSAIFPTGKQPDGAYWFDGRFVTSTYYRDAVPAWVEAFNTSGRRRQLLRQGLDAVPPRPRLREVQRPGRRPRRGQGRRPGDDVPAPDHRRQGQARQGRTTRRWPTRRSATTCCWRSPRRASTAEKLGPGRRAGPADGQLLVERPDRPHLGAGLAGGARRHPAVGRPDGRPARRSSTRRSGRGTTRWS